MNSIALIEDNAAVRAEIVTSLERAGFRVAGFGSVAELKVGCPDFGPDVVLCDVTMPGCSSLGAIQRCQAECGRCLYILMSSYSVDELIGRGNPRPPGVHFISKPFSAQAIADLIADHQEAVETRIQTADSQRSGMPVAGWA